MSWFRRKNKPKKALKAQVTRVQGNLDTLPILASAMTGMMQEKDALEKRIPADYGNRSVREAIDYMASHNIDPVTEIDAAHSIKEELAKRGCTAMANGRQADMDKPLGDYLVVRQHNLRNGGVREYREVDFEVSAVQQGGYR